MRYLLAALAFAAVLYGNVSAQAEKRIFIIANNADGYGVDRCLATGATCGAAVATAYCQSRDFAQAASFRKVDRDEITGAIPRPAACAAAPATNSSPSSARAERHCSIRRTDARFAPRASAAARPPLHIARSSAIFRACA